MQNKIVAIVGMPGAGKTEATKHLVKKGFVKVYFGDCTFDEIKRRGLETSGEIEKMVREGLRDKYGMAAFAILSMSKIDRAYKQGNVVIESMYSWDEYKEVKKKFGDKFKVVAICANKDLRHKRIIERKEYKNGVLRRFTIKDVVERDIAQIENAATGGPIGIADFTVINEGSLDGLYKNLDVVLDKTRRSYFCKTTNDQLPII